MAKLKLESEPERLLGKVFELCDGEYDAMLDVFADVLRLKPIEEANKKYADASYAAIFAFVKAALGEKPNEYFHKFVPAKEQLGQIFTPAFIVDFIVTATMGMTEEPRQLKFLEQPERGKNVLDPAVGPGIFLIRAMSEYQKIVVFGVDIDLRMVRTCMLNLRMFFPFRRWLVLCANALITDVKLGAENWKYANTWTPPPWEEMKMEDGRTWPEYNRVSSDARG